MRPGTGYSETEKESPGRERNRGGSTRRRGPKKGTVPMAQNRLTKDVLDGDLRRAMRFSDFIFQVGIHYALPGRPESIDAPPKLVRTRWWLVVTALVAVAWAVVARPTPERHAERTLPWDVLGEWKSSTPPYAGRGMTLYRDSLVLHVGQNEKSAGFPITGVRRQVVGDSTKFTVRYEQAHRETQVRFTFLNSIVPTLALDHSDAVLTRTAEQPIP